MSKIIGKAPFTAKWSIRGNNERYRHSDMAELNLTCNSNLQSEMAFNLGIVTPELTDGYMTHSWDAMYLSVGNVRNFRTMLNNDLSKRVDSAIRMQRQREYDRSTLK